MAGCKGFDVSASPEIVAACKEGIEYAFSQADPYWSDDTDPPFITVSVGMPGDHHVRKAIITNDCVKCNLCIPVCPTDAIPDNLQVIDHL